MSTLLSLILDGSIRVDLGTFVGEVLEMIKRIRNRAERGATAAGILIGMVLGTVLLIFAIVKFLIPGE